MASTPEASGERGGRREKILVAAADLVARRGYHAASLAEIGGAAGITGPGVYRHFERKSALLVELLDRVADELLVNALEIVKSENGPRAILDELIADQVRFAITKRALIQVYLVEVNNLPDDDRRRLRRKQRRYLEEWVNVVGTLRPEINYEEARSLVHGAIGVIQSLLDYTSPLDPEQLNLMIFTAAKAVLRIPITRPNL